MNTSTTLSARRWEILFRNQESGIRNQEEIVQTLLANRGLKAKKDIDAFLSPNLDDVTIASVGIDKKQLKKAVKRIKEAIKNQEQTVIYGDYDVDGICGSAILWETLHGLGAKVLPYIPHRIDEGYGLSIKGIENINGVKLIITVDNGIVANEAVDFANKNGIDVIITDHHVPPAGRPKKLPKAFAIVHTTKLCGTGVAWMLANSILHMANSDKTISDKQYANSHLELVALATIADLVPLLEANRILTKYGLEALHKTKRVGLLALFKEAGINGQIGTYEVGHIIAPRLNAMGRLESAMDSLRLLCTQDTKRAELLAHKIASTNRERQMVTEETIIHAKQQITGNTLHVASRKLLFISHESYQQGVIGLVAGKLVEEFYRPAIVVSKGEKFSKASARSVHGLNIIEFIRSATEFLVDAGGHPMAAGFTVETEKLPLLQQKLEELAEKLVIEEMLTRTLRIDCEIELSYVTPELFEKLSQLSPFGMNNPQPTFVSRNVVVDDMRLVGADGRHIKLQLTINNSQFTIGAIAFGMGGRSSEFHIGDSVDVVYTVEENKWNGNRRLQLKIKDIKVA